MTVDLSTVDISKVNSETAGAVVDAAKSLGFIYISGHGITPSLMNKMWQTSEQFFATSAEAKERYKIDASNKGWSRMHSETLDPSTQKKGDFKEAFNIDLAADTQQALPGALNAHRDALEEFERRCRETSARLLDLLALGLGKTPDFFSSKHNKAKPSGTVLRLLYYPALDSSFEQGDIRAGAHTDYGTLTLLFVKAGGSGLEVLPPNAHKDAWQAVPPPPVASDDDEAPVPILVNVADQLEFWTEGVLKSTLHRVTSAPGEGDRYSIAYFCHPDDDTVLSMKPNTTNRATREEVLTAGEHLRRRLAATYDY